MADSLTPIAAYDTLRQLAGGRSFLFESAPAAGQAARYSIIGLGACAELRVTNAAMLLSIDGAIVRRDLPTGAKVLAAARSMVNAVKPSQAELEASPLLGAYGAASFELAGYFERLPQLSRNDDPMPDLHLVVPETVVVFDHFTHELTMSSFAGTQRLEQIRSVLESARVPALADGRELCSVYAVAAPIAYADAVDQAKEAIYAGEAFQIVLARHWSATMSATPFDAYRALRAINPSPYMYFLELGWGELFGSSPELLATVNQGRARIRPLAGTRARGAHLADDARLARQLKRDPKERAEHLMLVDLGRNDLARVCAAGSVRVNELLSVERYSHVMHLVSDIVGDLRPECDAFDLFAAAFPAGTVSGAPKIRAMELIAQLEGRRRGFYAGSVCRFGFDGSLDACITLRSAHVYDDLFHLSAGAGIVAASDPERENAECAAKAQVLIAALERASAGHAFQAPVRAQEEAHAR